MKIYYRFAFYSILAMLSCVSCNSEEQKETKKNGKNDRVTLIGSDTLPTNAIEILNTIDPNLATYSARKVEEVLDSTLFGDLSLMDKIEIYRSLVGEGESINNITAPISKSLHTRLVNPIDGMKGVIHRWSEVAESIDTLILDHGSKFVNVDDFFVYSEYARINSNELTIVPGQEVPELRKKLLKELSSNHNLRFEELMRHPRIQNEQDFLDSFFVDKWTIVNSIGYGDSLIVDSMYSSRNAIPIRTLYDVGAVCPPICPKVR